MSPPENAVVFSVDEKSQIQALERTSMEPRMFEGQTHDYYRHGTTSLCAVLNVAAGKVVGKYDQKHRQDKVIEFLMTVENNAPEEKDIHLILDNDSTHQTEEVNNGDLTGIFISSRAKAGGSIN